MRVRDTLIALLAVWPWIVAAGPATTTAPATAPPTTTVAASEPVVGNPPFPTDRLTMTAAATHVWSQGSLGVAELHGPAVKIVLGTAQLEADDAVVFLRPKSADGTRSVDIVLVGHAQVTQGKITFGYDRYWVPAIVSGPIRLLGPRTEERDDRSMVYRAATALLREQRPTIASTSTAPATTTSATTTTPAGPADLVPMPPAGPSAGEPVATKVLGASFTNLDVQRTSDGNLAYVCTGGVGLRYRDLTGDLLEFSADSMVLFTDLKDMRDAGGGKDAIGEHVVSGYFEGDVRVFMTPHTPPPPTSKNELRMRAERIYYEFATDRAVMKDVVFHTTDAKKGIPIFMRAATVRQLSRGEFKAQGVEMTTSPFATPTYGLGAGSIYVRGEDSGDPRVGERVAFAAQDVTLNAFGYPFLYFPQAGGTMTARGSIFRGVGVEDTNKFGFGVRTQWGLFETLGDPPPEHVDATYSLDYYSNRGPAGGIDATYNGGTVSDLTKQPYNFEGDLHAYFLDDHGTDVLGSARNNEPAPQEFRGRVTYEHEHDFGDDVTAQVRLGYLSDSNFMPEFFFNEYQNGLPIDESVYVKHQTGSEVASFLTEWQPNRVVSIADYEQENREVSHLPELEYQRVGDSVAGDRLTFFSDNDVTGTKFVRSEQSLKQQGFYGPFVEPGLPAYAYTGDPGNTTFRGDFRQEVDYPINLGVLHVVPYVMGRYTVYNQGVTPVGKVPTVLGIPERVTVSSDRNRLIGGGGVRLTTDFWRVDDSVQSDLFDIHRIRHVITPELNVFASGQTVDQDQLFIYDPSRDALNDVQAMQIALRQRWQTKRGGAGRWRSVDVLALDLYANLFANQPAARFRDPTDFRSVFLQSEPEYSIPRNTANADATWRISDTTAVLSSVVQNLDQHKLATASVGVAVQRGDRLTYFVGNRYIADLNSNVATFEASYQLDRKYTIGASESVDLAQSKNVYYIASITRAFDNFSAAIDVHYDESTNDSGFGFSLSPNGLARGLGSTQLQQQQQP